MLWLCSWAVGVSYNPRRFAVAKLLFNPIPRYVMATSGNPICRTNEVSQSDSTETTAAVLQMFGVFCRVDLSVCWYCEVARNKARDAATNSVLTVHTGPG